MTIKKFFKNKKILITGGTGSIGSQILHHLIPMKPKRIVVFSRDEYKQYQMRFKYPSTEHTQIEYQLGDVRDVDSLTYSSEDIDILFHCSAYKHVPQSQEMPEEFIKTNVLGSMNVKKAAIKNKISTVVSISSDKAVNPSNVMGLTKALQEKIFASHYLQKQKSVQKFVSVRFGNVIGTKGSLFPIFYHQIINNMPITITDPSMTRFFMTKEEAVKLIFWAAVNGKDGETVIKKMKSIAIGALLKIFLEETKQKSTYPVKQIGIRVGEKLHEGLITDDELFKVKQKEDYYIVGPYSEEEIEQNVILSSLKRKPKKMQEFLSETKENFFTERAIRKYVRIFIKDFENTHQIL